MAITVNEMMAQLAERYQLQLQAGGSDLNYVVTWVHMMEDASVADFFWGNEMIVTSGYAAGEAGLLELLRTLDKKRCAGVVVNVGPYIRYLPEEVLNFCNENQLPLFTMPWDMSMTEFVRASCTLITRSVRQEEELARAVLAAVRNPRDPGGYYAELSELFEEKSGFRMLALNLQREITDPGERAVFQQRVSLRIHTALQDMDLPYLVFRNEERVFILLNATDEKTANAAAERILSRLRARFSEIPMQLGIGDSAGDYVHLSDTYHSALSAQRCALLQGHDVVRFSEMGFYRLLYSVPDDELLRRYYREVLAPVLDYDEKHGSNLTETLFRYLLLDGSLSLVADAMYSHRNTINYRMGRIRELLGCDLAGTQERMPYQIAYHIGVILGLNPSYE